MSLENYTGVHVKHYPDGVIMCKKNYKNGKAEGLQEFWFPNGVKSHQYTLQDGINVGTATRWFDNGNVEIVDVYEGDKLTSKRYS